MAVGSVGGVGGVTVAPVVGPVVGAEWEMRWLEAPRRREMGVRLEAMSEVEAEGMSMLQDEYKEMVG